MTHEDSFNSESEHSDLEDFQESLLDKILSVKRDIKIFQKHKEYACDQSHAYLLRKTKKWASSLAREDHNNL